MLALNRSAIVVRPRPPFLAWLHTVDPTSVALTLADLCREPTIYLVPECGDPEAEGECLQTLFPAIFEDQLNGWWRVPASWPRDRAFETYGHWFDCQFHSMLIDLSDEPLIEGHL